MCKAGEIWSGGVGGDGSQGHGVKPSKANKEKYSFTPGME